MLKLLSTLFEVDTYNNTQPLMVINHWVMAILSGHNQGNMDWNRILLIFFLVSTWVATIVQCAIGYDVLRWRSFYASHDNAWRAHYQEVFDRGIHEVSCCLGRTKYSYVPIRCWFLDEISLILVGTMLLTLFFTLPGVCWKMMIYVLWRSYWVTLWYVIVGARSDLQELFHIYSLYQKWMKVFI
jgi:hypothetical protein